MMRWTARERAGAKIVKAAAGDVLASMRGILRTRMGITGGGVESADATAGAESPADARGALLQRTVMTPVPAGGMASRPHYFKDAVTLT